MAQTFDTVPHVVLTAHGALPGGESWSCGLRTTLVAAGVVQATLQAAADAATTAWKTLVQTAGIGFTNGCTLSGVTARSLDSRGITTTLAEGINAVPAFASSALAFPNQCSLAVTLITARAGRTGKGRIYLPTLGLAMGLDGCITPAAVTAIKTPLKALFDALNTGIAGLDGAPRIAVQSKSGPTNAGAGYTGAAVTAIRIGNVVDTQRRRRDSVTETYTSMALA